MLKKIGVLTLIAFLAFGLTLAAAQEKKEKKEDLKQVKDDKFLNSIWKKVDKLAKEQRSFKTEKATTVAGVRGDEAEDTALKQLYYKGGGNYPTRLQLKNAIEILEKSLKQEPDAENVPETMYYIAQCYEKLGENNKAIRYYEDIVADHAKSKFAVDAKTALKALKKN